MLLLVNGQPTSIGFPLPEKITSLKIMFGPGVMVPKEQVPKIKKWLNLLVSKLEVERIDVNGALVDVKDIKIFKDV